MIRIKLASQIFRFEVGKITKIIVENEIFQRRKLKSKDM
jgi:hypothetical protein